jgi:hypothetical protein
MGQVKAVCSILAIAAGMIFTSFQPDPGSGQAKAAEDAGNDQTPTVVTYPGPAGVKASPYYSVDIMKGKSVYNSFAYISKNQFPEVNIESDDTSWTTFSFSGKVTVVVTSHGLPITSCNILPSRLGIAPRIYPDRVEFELSSPAKLSVEINGSIKHPLLVFADPLETEPPPVPGPNVLIFPPGYHDVGRVELRSNQTVYLSGGAYVKGYFDGGINKTNITIRGRGVLSGEDYKHKSHHLIEIMGNKTGNIQIEGITMVNSPWTHLRMWGEHNTVRNVKMISWYHNTDGILLGANSVIEDCFFKLNDDAIKLYHSGIRVRNCVLWQLANGAPFQLTWNVSVPTGDVKVSDCDVIRVEHRSDWDNKAIFNSIHGGTGHLSSYLFENIYIENANFRLVKLIFKKTVYNEEQIGFGQISDITFRNIHAANGMKKKNVLTGYDADHGIRNLTFENVTVNQKPLTMSDFEIDGKSVKDIHFVNNQTETGQGADLLKSLGRSRLADLGRN